MTIKNQINNDLKDAMRARDTQKLNALRLITAAIKQIEVDERIEVNDERLLTILNKLAKQRNESIVQFKAANRNDLVVQEEFELALINHYLPEPLTDAEITALIEQTLVEVDAKAISDMGKVMNQLKASTKGRADMSKISAMIKARLNQN